MPWICASLLSLFQCTFNPYSEIRVILLFFAEVYYSLAILAINRLQSSICDANCRISEICY